MQIVGDNLSQPRDIQNSISLTPLIALRHFDTISNAGVRVARLSCHINF
jgi:hypothetical protein